MFEGIFLLAIVCSANRRDGEEERQEEPGRERARDAHFAGRLATGACAVACAVKCAPTVRCARGKFLNDANKHNNITPDTLSAICIFI